MPHFMSTLASFYISLNKRLKNGQNKKGIFFLLLLRGFVHFLLVTLKKSQFAFEATAPRSKDGTYLISYQQYKQLQRKTRYSFASSFIILLVAALTIGFYFPNFPGREPKIARAQNVYVSTAGNDGNDCLSLENACLTIGGAFGKANYGDIINIAAGTYPYEDIRIFGGRNGITLQGADRESTILQSTILITWGIDSFTINNLTLSPTTLPPTVLEIRSGNSNVTIDSVAITGYDPDGPSQGTGILLYNGISDITLTNNRIYGGVYGIRSGNAGDGESSNLTISNNTIFNNTGHGILFDTTPASAVSVINNTIVNNSGTGFGVNFSSDNLSGGSSIKNNILAYNQYGITFTEGSNTLIENNNVYGNTTANYDGITAPSSDISVNPAFTDADNNDYTLQTCSPSIDKGKSSDSAASEPSPNGSRVNQGAEGGTASANTSPTSSSKCNYYVNAATGNNNNTGLSSESPWQTLTFAVGTILENSNINLAAGTYTGNATIASWKNNLSIIGAGINSTTIVGTVASEAASNFTNFSLSGLTIDANGGNLGIDLRSPNTTSENANWTLSQVKVTDYAVTGIQLGSGVAVSGTTLKNITLSEIMLDGGTEGVSGSAQGILTGSQMNFENFSLTNSRIYTHGGDGIQINQNVTNLTIKNNTIHGNTGDGIEMGNYTITGSIRNNIISNNGNYGINYGGSTLDATVAYNNVFESTAGNYNAITAGAGNISADPLYTDSASADFSLQTSSPSIDAGDPDDSYSNEPSPNGCRINQGFDGNTSSTAASASEACGFYVDATLGNDSNTCSAVGSEACRTITQVLSRASGGTSVAINVAAGSYGDGETFPISLRSGITLQGAGASTTTLVIPTDQASGISLNGNITFLKIDGFTIIGAGASTIAIQLQDLTATGSSGITISNNVIKGNNTGNIGIKLSPASGTINNNVFYGFASNAINITQGEISTPPSTTVNLTNNSVYGPSGISLIDEVADKTLTATIKNNIIQSADGSGTGMQVTGTVNATATYNNVYYTSGTRYSNLTGTNDLNIDCLFTDTSSGDFTLQSSSSCLDAGDPSETDPNGSRIDLGAYGGTLSAGRRSGRSRDIIPPGIPTNLKANITSEGTQLFIKLTWKDPADSDLRLIHILRGKFPFPASGNEYSVVRAGAQSFTDEDIQVGAKYEYMVRAVDKSGNVSEASAPVNISLTPPPAIQDLRISERAKDGLTLQFTPPNKEEFPKAFLEIRYLENGILTEENFKEAPRYEFPSKKEEENSVVPGVKITGLKEDTEYSIAIRVVSGGLYSGISNVTQAKTLDATPPGPIENPSLLNSEREKSKTSLLEKIFSMVISATGSPPVGNITLSWIEPADNGTSTSNGNLISFYDVRYSSDLITEENFNTFGEVISYINTWVPKNPGETHEETLSKIPATTKYIAIKACDEAKNCSPLTLFEVDLLPPPPITDLQVIKEKTNFDRVSLRFSPIDREKYPTASLEIRYMKDGMISEENFSNGSKFILDALQEQVNRGEVTLTNLEADTSYSFGIKVVNKNGASKLSNTVSDSTKDNLSPQKIQDLKTLAVTTDSVTFSFQESSDNGNLDTAKKITSYEVRYSLTEIYESNFDQATHYETTWSPLLPGEIHTETLKELPQGTSFIALKACDEAKNCSELSSLNLTLVTPGRKIIPEEPLPEESSQPNTPIEEPKEPITEPSGTGSSGQAPTLSPIPILQKVEISDPVSEENGQVTATIKLSGSRDTKTILIGVHVESNPFETQFIPDLSKDEWKFEIRLPFEPGEHSVYVWGVDESGIKSENSIPQKFQIVGEKVTVNSEITPALSVSNSVNNPMKEIFKVLSDNQNPSPSPSSTARIIESIVDNPILEETTTNVVIPVITTIVLANAATVSGGFNFLSYLQYLFTSPILLVARRRRKGWGVVYHALSKKPIDLAIVRLFDRKTNQLIETRVTDKDGRYQFIVPKGQYYLTVTKPSFLFPTSYLEFKKNDIDYLDLYHGDTINITSDNENIALNIPLDPREKKKESLSDILGRRFLRRSQGFVAFSGIILAFVSFLISPIPILLIILGIHIVLFLIFRRLSFVHKPKNWGLVYDTKTKKPLQNVIIRIFDTEFHRLLETQITDRSGRYAFLVGNNLYYITAEKEGYKALKTEEIDLTKKGSENVVKHDLALIASKR